MQGKILEYNADLKRGLIHGEDGNEYRFIIDEFDSLINPAAGSEVTFEPIGDKATDLYIAANDEVEDIKATIYPTTHIGDTTLKKSMPAIMKFILIFGIGAFLVVILLSVLEDRQRKQLQVSYEDEIKNIENLIHDGHCSEAASEYLRSRDTRNEIDKKGGYYSFEPHPLQAHSIDIAECFAQRGNFANAIQILNIEEVNDIDYLRRASKVYEKAGDHAKAREAKSKADKYSPLSIRKNGVIKPEKRA